MDSYQLGGIQQIGIGVRNLREAWEWYIRIFGMDCRIFDDETEARFMLPYTGGKPQSRHAILALNLQSGGGFEIWQYKGRAPVSISEEIALGDLGILLCKMKVRNIDEAFAHLKASDCSILGTPVEDPEGKLTFFIKDPFGNIFQMVSDSKWFMKEGKVTGGAYGASIGVTDIDRSRAVYSGILGYDKVVYDITATFPDLASLPGGSNEFRRVLLRRSLPFSGFFSDIFGQSEIELISSAGTPGKRIYKDRFWGDPGFIHLCYDMWGMDNLRDFCRDKGFPFVVDSKESRQGSSFDMGEAAGHFAYIEDPDGILIEFVESHKLPVIKKLGWYLDLTKRRKYKPLPKWMVKALRFSKVKNP